MQKLKDINKAVKRNIERFPEDFYFQLTEKEYNNLRFQFGTSSLQNNYGGIRYLPFVFTEEGVAMLSSVLHTEISKQVSVDIMRAFVRMRKYISNSIINNEMLINHENRILKLENTFNKLNEKEK